MTAFRKTEALVSALGTAVGSLWSPDRSPRVALEPGDMAPEFSLEASDGRTYRLADYRGQRAVVVAWFPKAFTAGCTAECQSIGLSGKALRGFEAAVFAASCDTAELNREFAASTGIDVPILSAPDGAVARAYGVMGPLGLPSRWTVYIGADGRLLDIDRAVKFGHHGADILAALDRFGIARRP